MKTFVFASYFFAAVICSVFFIPTASFAQETTISPAKDAPSPTSVPAPTTGIDLTVSPVFINLLTDPGKEVKTQVKIRNNSNITEFLTIDLKTFKAAQNGTQPQLADVPKDDTFRSWISFSEDTFSLAPNQTKTIDVTIKPSSSAALGYYYALVFQRTSEKGNTQTGALIAGAPAISLLLEVKSPTTTRELQLVDFSTDSLIYEYLPTTFKVRVKNTGNIHAVAVGDIFIDSSSKEDIGIIRINEARGNILPQSEREFTVQWNDGMISKKEVIEDGKAVVDDKGNATYDVSWDFSKADKFRFGKYTAHALVVYDNGERDIPLEAKVSFWILPWKLMGIGLLIIILVFAGLRSMISSGIRSFSKKKK